MKKDRRKINCQNCRFWSFDMDMEPFCVHANAGVIGTYITAMRGENKTPHIRGEPCGPQAQFFKQSNSRFAKKERNA